MNQCKSVIFLFKNNKITEMQLFHNFFTTDVPIASKKPYTSNYDQVDLPNNNSSSNHGDIGIQHGIYILILKTRSNQTLKDYFSIFIVYFGETDSVDDIPMKFYVAGGATGGLVFLLLCSITFTCRMVVGIQRSISMPKKETTCSLHILFTYGNFIAVKALTLLWQARI